MHFTATLTSLAALLHLPLTTAQDLPIDHGGGNDKWPAHLWPKVRIENWNHCGQGPGNGGKHRNTYFAPADNCLDVKAVKWKHPPEEDAEDMLGAVGNRTQYQQTLDHYNMSDYSSFRALYWEMPYVIQEDILKPAVRCNITVYDWPRCTGYPVVKFTNEAQDVCIPAHGGHSIRVDCYTADELKKYAKAYNMTDFPPKSWKETAIARYKPDGRWAGEGTTNMQVLPRMDMKKRYDREKEPELYARSLDGRYITCRMLEQSWWDRCMKNPLCGGQKWSKVTCP